MTGCIDYQNSGSVCPAMSYFCRKGYKKHLAERAKCFGTNENIDGDFGITFQIHHRYPLPEVYSVFWI